MQIWPTRTTYKINAHIPVSGNKSVTFREYGLQLTENQPPKYLRNAWVGGSSPPSGSRERKTRKSMK